jgi:hypothetical protein
VGSTQFIYLGYLLSTALLTLLCQFTNAERVCRILGATGLLSAPLCRIHLVRCIRVFVAETDSVLLQVFKKISAAEVAQVLRLVWRYLQLSTAAERDPSSGPVTLDDSFSVPLRLLLHRHIEKLGQFYKYLQP